MGEYVYIRLKNQGYDAIAEAATAMTGEYICPAQVEAYDQVYKRYCDLRSDSLSFGYYKLLCESPLWALNPFMSSALVPAKKGGRWDFGYRAMYMDGHIYRPFWRPLLEALGCKDIDTMLDLIKGVDYG